MMFALSAFTPSRVNLEFYCFIATFCHLGLEMVYEKISKICVL